MFVDIFFDESGFTGTALLDPNDLRTDDIWVSRRKDMVNCVAPDQPVCDARMMSYRVISRI